MGRGVPVEFGPRALLALPRGAALAYRDSVGASGNPPLMLVHGLGITADLNWSPAYAELCQRFRVVAPDLPGFAAVDFSMTKNTALAEAMNLQFRFEAFNLFNRVNLGNPGRNVFDTSGRPNSLAGRITDSQTARQLQLSFKLIF